MDAIRRAVRGAPNPLAAALVSMAVHTVVALALRWPYPSAATALAGVLGVALAGRLGAGLRGFLATVTAASLSLPVILPPAIVAAVGSAGVARLACRTDDPVRNLALSLPALVVLALALTP